MIERKIYIDTAEQALVGKYYQAYGVSKPQLYLDDYFLYTCQLSSGGDRLTLEANQQYKFTIEDADEILYEQTSFDLALWDKASVKHGRICWVVDLDGTEIFNEFLSADSPEIDVTCTLSHYDEDASEWEIYAQWDAEIARTVSYITWLEDDSSSSSSDSSSGA